MFPSQLPNRVYFMFGMIDRDEFVALRRKAFAPFKTQDQVDAEIDRLIAIANTHEDKRDGCKHESPEYWKCHDQSVKYHERARLLMPLGA